MRVDCEDAFERQNHIYFFEQYSTFEKKSPMIKVSQWMWCQTALEWKLRDKQSAYEHDTKEVYLI